MLQATRTPDWDIWLVILGIMGLLFLGFMLLGFGTITGKKTARYPYVMAIFLFATIVGGLFVNYQNNIAEPVAAKGLPGTVYRVNTEQLRTWAWETYGLSYNGIGEYNNFTFSDSDGAKSCTYRIFKAEPIPETDNGFQLQAQLVCDGTAVAPIARK